MPKRQLCQPPVCCRGVLSASQSPGLPFSFSPNFGRFPGDQTLNTATVSLLPPRALADAWLPGPRGQAGLELLLGKRGGWWWLMGLRTGHNRLGAPSSLPPPCLPPCLPSSPLSHLSPSSPSSPPSSLSLIPSAAWEPGHRGGPGGARHCGATSQVH